MSSENDGFAEPDGALTKALSGIAAACVPMASQESIIRWQDVRAGDLVLLGDCLVTAERVEVVQKPWGDGMFAAADISWRLENGFLVTSERHGDRLTAVRRAAVSPPEAREESGVPDNGREGRASGQRGARGRTEALGRLVREAWVAWAREQDDPKPSWLVPWEELGDGQREADIRIGEAVAAGERARTGQRDPVVDAVDVLFDRRHHLATDVLRSLRDIWACGSAAKFGEPHETWEHDQDFYASHDTEECEDDGESQSWDAAPGLVDAPTGGWQQEMTPDGLVCAAPEPDNQGGICGYPADTRPCPEHAASAYDAVADGPGEAS